MNGLETLLPDAANTTGHAGAADIDMAGVEVDVPGVVAEVLDGR